MFLGYDWLVKHNPNNIVYKMSKDNMKLERNQTIRELDFYYICTNKAPQP